MNETRKAAAYFLLAFGEVRYKDLDSPQRQRELNKRKSKTGHY